MYTRAPESFERSRLAACNNDRECPEINNFPFEDHVEPAVGLGGTTETAIRRRKNTRVNFTKIRSRSGKILRDKRDVRCRRSKYTALLTIVGRGRCGTMFELFSTRRRLTAVRTSACRVRTRIYVTFCEVFRDRVNEPDCRNADKYTFAWAFHTSRITTVINVCPCAVHAGSTGVKPTEICTGTRVTRETGEYGRPSHDRRQWSYMVIFYP